MIADLPFTSRMYGKGRRISKCAHLFSRNGNDLHRARLGFVYRERRFRQAAMLHSIGSPLEVNVKKKLAALY